MKRVRLGIRGWMLGFSLGIAVARLPLWGPEPVPNVAREVPNSPAVSAAQTGARKEPVEPTKESPDPSKQVQGIRIVSGTFGDHDAGRGYEIDVEYPQIAEPSSPFVERFNRLVKARVFRTIDSLRGQSRSDLRRRNDTPDITDELNISYTAPLATPKLVSVRLDSYAYSWPAAHGGNTAESITFDLEAGRPVRLANLFLPKSAYLEGISRYCVDELNRRGLGNGRGGFLGYREDGASPKPENYTTWNVTHGGLLIQFAEYQVGPHSAGRPEVLVPFDVLKEYIDPKGPLALSVVD